MESLLNQVTRELMSSGTSEHLPAGLLKQWMNSESLEVMGAVFKLLHKPEHYSRIEPPLLFDDYRLFHLKYYERCLREDPDGMWCDSRYIAAHSMVGWFTGLWNDEKVPRDALRELKALLGRLYQEGDSKLKVAIVTGALEHLFADPKILKFFSDWEHDDCLKTAYYEALTYGLDGPKQ